jgi:uncharacterized protein YxjI
VDDEQGLIELDRSSHLVIEQATEFVEAFAGFETANQYMVHGDDGAPLFHVAEEDDGILRALLRNFMNTARPFKLHVVDAQTGALALLIDRPFRFYFHKCDVGWGDGEALGAVVRKLSFINRRYSLQSPDGETIFEIKGPIWKPWTFEVFDDDDTKVAVIKKKWSGIGREAFTDADVFGIEFEAELEPEDKLMLMSAVFLIDMLHFESSNRRRH